MEYEREARMWAADNPVTIFIDELGEGGIKGRFMLVGDETMQPFSNLASLVLQLDKLMDSGVLPQLTSDQEDGEALHRDDMCQSPNRNQDTSDIDLSKSYGNIATFLLYIRMRRNKSWQGNIAWLEGNREAAFRSVLELLHLMRSACG